MAELAEATQEALRRLVELSEDDGPVLSAYVSLAGPEVRTPETLRLEIDSRLNEAEKRLRGEIEGEASAKALGACLEQAHRTLENAPLDDHALQAVAVFCREAGEPLAYGLRRPVEFTVAAAFRPRPVVEPMLEALGGERWAVALVSRKHGRVFAGTESALAELGDVEDDVHRWHSQGGWSQARFQRGVEKETKDHVERVCDLLFAMHERRPIDHLAIGGPEELRPLVEERLHPYLRERLAGQLTIDVDAATPERVLEQLAPLAGDLRQARERQAIGRLEAGLGTGDQAVAGMSEVLSALGERRVETLLLTAGDASAQAEQAVEEAVAQSAGVLAFEDDSLARFGGIAALLRF